jgi:hypothetical protein
MQTHSVPHTKNPDVLRDSPVFGEGTGIDIKNANTYTQADLYVALATRVNKYLRTIEKDKGWGAIAIRTRMMRAATKSAEDYFAANGIYLHLDQGARKPRFALTMTNILDTLLPLEGAAKGSNRDAQQLISAALYNVEGKPKFANDVQIAQVGSSVKASIQPGIPDAVCGAAYSPTAFSCGHRKRQANAARHGFGCTWPAVASDESHKMIATFLRLIQGMSWGMVLTREDQFFLHVSQCFERSFPFDLAVAIGAVMPVLECQRFLPKL